MSFDSREPLDRARRRLAHSPIIVNGRPSDLQPLETIDPLRWQDKPVPERRWVVPDLIPEGNVTMLGGDGGHGKTLLALQLLIAAALGKSWIGYNVRRCRAIGIFCEDDPGELHRRVADILKHYGAEFGDLEDLTLVSRVGDENTLVEFQDPWQVGNTTKFYSQVEHLSRESGAELMVLDSLHDMFAGNENARPHARQFVNELRTLTIGMQGRGAVLLTAHPSLSGRNSGSGEAGSTAWNNTVRSRLYLTAPRADEPDSADRDYRELRTKKANYGPSGNVLRLRWADGVFVRDEEPTGVLGTIKHRAVEAVFLELLAALAAEGRHLTDWRSAQNYAPRVFAKHPGRQGYRLQDFVRAMESLFADKKIVVREFGRTGDRRKRIEVAGAVHAVEPPPQGGLL